MIACGKCGIEKGPDGFYPHSGRTRKECVKSRVRENRRERREQYREYERQRYRRPARRAYSHAKSREYRLRNPEKVKARSAVSNALRAGRLQRPDRCPRCGCEGRIEAHHSDYNKPLVVQWLCSLCHGEEHAAA